jgi:hypothetical protein
MFLFANPFNAWGSTPSDITKQALAFIAFSGLKI